MKFCAYNNWICKTNPKSVGPISPTVLGAVGPEQYQFLYCIDSHPTAAALCWADWPNTPPPPVVLCWADRPNTTLTQRGGHSPPPLSWQGGGLSLWQFRHTCWANCSTCSRLTLPKTAVRDGVNKVCLLVGSCWTYCDKETQVKMYKKYCFNYITSLKVKNGKDPCQIEKQDPDLYHSEKQDLDPYQKGLNPEHCCGSLPRLAHVESCEAETCPPPPIQDTTCSLRGMDQDRAHQGDSHSQAAQSVITRYGIVYVYFFLYFSSSNTVSWNTQKVYPGSIDCYLLGWLTTLQNKKLPRAIITLSGLCIQLITVLWSRNFLFPLRLSKSFGSGSSSGSDISFITTFYQRFHIKKWIIHVFYERISI